MTPERWQQVEELYHRVLGCPESDRDGLLREECSNDDDLRQQVESLLKQGDVTGGFIEQAVDQAAREMDGRGASASWVNRQIGAYRIVSLLGAGGMGEVYLARDTRLKREVAIKVLHSSVAHEPDHLARIQREARLLASMNHPNIA